MNPALQLLLERSSCPRLQAPAPDPAQLELMFRAAVRAPDHGHLRPWRFLVVQGDGLHALGELYAKALLSSSPDATQEQLKRVRSMPLRAPMIVVLVACLQEHPKVPEYEQLIAAGCAGHGMLLAAQAQGMGAFWRSGEMCEHSHVHKGLGLQDNERIIGYIYLGTPCPESRQHAGPDPAGFVSSWPPA